MSTNTVVYAGGALLASEATGITNLTPIGRDGDGDGSGGGSGGFGLGGISLPEIALGDGPSIDFSGLGEGLGELAQNMSENASENFEIPSLPTGPQIPGPDDLQNMTDSAGESVGSSVGTALGTAMYQLIKTPSLALAEDIEPYLPYAEGDAGDTIDAMWQDSATRALADAMEGPLPYAEGDWQDTKKSVSDDVNAVTDGVNNVVSTATETASAGVTGDSNTNVASETADRIQKTIDAGLTGDSNTNLASETKQQVQKDVGNAVEQGFKIDNPMTGTSIDDTLNSAGLETNYQWDGPTVDDGVNAVKDAGGWLSDNMAKVPL